MVIPAKFFQAAAITSSIAAIPLAVALKEPAIALAPVTITLAATQVIDRRNHRT
jgi:hypothetical protein